MTKLRVHSYVSTSAKLALGLLIASTCCLSTAWSDISCGNGYCDGPVPSTDSGPRTGGCGFVSGGPMDRGQTVATRQVIFPQVARQGYLSPVQISKVKQIVNACLIVTQVDRMPTGLHIAQAQIRPGCQNYIQYIERSNVDLGALNLGNEVLQMRITTRDGRDGDENTIEFAENGKIIASYRRTDDSIENGLALLKTLFN